MKCVIKGCENHKDQGLFVGDLCNPCYVYLKRMTNTKEYSKAAFLIQRACNTLVRKAEGKQEWDSFLEALQE